MNDIDEWCADQCGVEIYTAIDDYDNEKPESCWINGGVVKWTIEDPKCREIVREHFKIITIRSYWTDDNGRWKAECRNPQRKSDGIFGYGDEIAEAECSCIEAIYRASNEQTQ